MHVGGGDAVALVRDIRMKRLREGRPARHIVLLLQEAVRLGDVPAMVPGASSAGWIGPAGLPNEVGALARELGMSILYVPSMRNGATAARGTFSDRGNAILSTLPLLDPVAVELPGVRQRRVGIVARIPVRLGESALALPVGVAHLDATTAAKRLWLTGASEIRALQAQSLTSAYPSGPAVLGADLNTWKGSEEPAARHLLGFFTSTPAMPRDATFKGSSFLPGLVLDYLFFRAPAGFEARYERISDRYGSDHHPLVGWFVPKKG
jgi:hypothetical protein